MTQEDEVRVGIIAETAKIPWKQLQLFFARGVVVWVKPEFSLVDIACYVAQNDEEQVKRLQDSAKLQAVSDEQATEWLEANALMWAVVIKPWVLVQPVLHA